MDKELKALVELERALDDLQAAWPSDHPQANPHPSFDKAQGIIDALAAQADAQPEPTGFLRNARPRLLGDKYIPARQMEAYRAGSEYHSSDTFTKLYAAPQPAQPQYPTMPPLPRYEEVPTVTGTKIIVGQPAQPDVARLWALSQGWKDRATFLRAHDGRTTTNSPNKMCARELDDCADELSATLTELGMKP